MDDRYTYGHGFSMLFLSQVLGEEEDVERREQLVEGAHQGGDLHRQCPDPDRRLGLRQRQGQRRLRRGLDDHHPGAGFAGLPQRGHPRPQGDHRARPSTTSTAARAADGGVQYNQTTPGGRPPITAAAIACLFNAGDYDDKYVPKLLAYCHRELDDLSKNNYGHWHYSHYYYSQVLYREGGKTWENYRDKVTRAPPPGSEPGGLLGPGLHGSGLHDGHESDHSATATRRLAHLPTLGENSL